MKRVYKKSYKQKDVINFLEKINENTKSYILIKNKDVNVNLKQMKNFI